MNLARAKLQSFCASLIPFSVSKGQVVHREGDPNNFVYFVRQGEIQISKKVVVPKLGTEVQDVAKILQDPKQGRH